MLVSQLLFSVMLAALTGIAYFDYRESVRRDRQKIVAVIAGGWFTAQILTNDDE